MDLDELASKLQQVKWNGSDKFTARCPAHDDAKASLAIRQLADRKVLHCFAGCTFDAIASSLGLSQSDFFDTHKNGHNGSNGNGRSPLSVVDKTKRPEFSGQTKLTRYEIKDIDGTLFAVHVRKDGTDDQGHKLKHLWWEQADGKIGLNGTKLANMPLYQTEILRETHPDTTIVVTEGEKAAQSLIDRGIVAVGTACGAAVTPSEHVLQCLAKFPDVVLWPDNDEAGREHMGKIASLLAQAGSGARIVDWSMAPPKGDAADFKGSRDAILQFLGTSTREVAAIRSSTNGAVVDPSTLPEPVMQLKMLDLGQLYDLVDEWDRQPWVWEGILPRASLSLIVGKSETGKSTLLYRLIYCIIRGLDFFGRKCERGRVLYLAGDPISEVVAGKTFREMGLARTDALRVVPGALVGSPTGMQDLRRWVSELRPTLVVGDTLAATVPIDTDKYGQSYQVQQPLTQIAREFSPNFLMSHHSQKSAIDTYSVIDSALGSVGVAAVASTRMGTKLHRRGGQKYYTFEMSNLRLGTPIEGEWIVTKTEAGMMELEQLWESRSQNLDKEMILKTLEKRTVDHPMAERTLWQQTYPKPKWGPFKEALEELLNTLQVRRTAGKRGGQLYQLERFAPPPQNQLV